MKVLWSLALGAWCFGAARCLAQPNPASPPPPTPPPPQDPLITLMLSQPSIDVNSAVTAVAEFDPPVVRPGELSIYRVTMNALEESVEWPSKIKGPEGLMMQAGAHGEVLQQNGPTLQPRTCFNYRVRASNPGEFTVPEFAVRVLDRSSVKIPAARLQVTTDAPPGPPAQRLVLEFSETNLFVGQTVRARIQMPFGPDNVIQMPSSGTARITGEGVVVDQGAVQNRIQPMPRAGGSVTMFLHETLVTPIAAGKLSLFAQAFINQHVSGGVILRNGGATLAFAQPGSVLLESDPVELSVQPLPRTGELPGFTGAVGNFMVDPPTLATNVLKVGNPAKLTITVRPTHGEASLARMVAPPAPQLRDWQVFSAPGDGASPQNVQARGFTSFNYILIPLTEGPQATPAIPFSCFDADQKRYVDLTILPIAVTVMPGMARADLQALLQQNPAAPGEEKEPELSGLAAAPGRKSMSMTPLQRQTWFPLMQLAPATALIGLWGWDRRRRYLEQHPEVVLRRRARRALRRERRVLRHAAQANDSRGFATSAVNAMRIACAPYYPAEPRALVGADVLQALDQADRSDRTDRLVRRFFAVSDASQFAVETTNGEELLQLRPELEGLLAKLEARL